MYCMFKISREYIGLGGVISLESVWEENSLYRAKVYGGFIQYNILTWFLPHTSILLLLKLAVSHKLWYWLGR